MKYVGLDLSTVSTGYSVFEGGVLKESGKVVPVEADVMTRIMEITDRLRKVVSHHLPDEIIIEDTFYGSNYLTTKILNRLAGSVYYAMTLVCKARITFVTPTTARQCLGILPASKKRNIVAAVNAKFGKDFKLKDNDEADGIVLGYYGVWRDGNPSKGFDKSTDDFFKKGVKTPRIKRRKK